MKKVLVIIVIIIAIVFLGNTITTENSPQTQSGSDLVGTWKQVKSFVVFNPDTNEFEEIPMLKRVDGGESSISITSDNKMCGGAIVNGKLVCDNPYDTIAIKGNRIVLGKDKFVVNYEFSLQGDKLELVYLSSNSGKPVVKTVYIRIK